MYSCWLPTTVYSLPLTPAPPAGKISVYALPIPLRGDVPPRLPSTDNRSRPADGGDSAAARARAGTGRRLRARHRRGLAGRAAREEPDGARDRAGGGGVEAR